MPISKILFFEISLFKYCKLLKINKLKRILQATSPGKNLDQVNTMSNGPDQHIINAPFLLIISNQQIHINPNNHTNPQSYNPKLIFNLIDLIKLPKANVFVYEGRCLEDETFYSFIICVVVT